MSGAPGTEGGAGSTKSRRNRKGCDLSAPPGDPALSARVRSLLAACPSWRTRFSAPRMHLLAPRALGAKLHALLTSLRRRRRSPPTNQFARQVAGPVRGRGRGRAPNTEETAYFRESRARFSCLTWRFEGPGIPTRSCSRSSLGELSPTSARRPRAHRARRLAALLTTRRRCPQACESERRPRSARGCLARHHPLAPAP